MTIEQSDVSMRVFNSEFFAIPSATTPDTFIGYAPLRGVLCRLNRDQAVILARLAETDDLAGVEAYPFVQALREAGVIAGPVEPRPASPAGAYAPTSGTLFLTNRCPMACRYCYAGQARSGRGTVAKEMPLPLARAAVDYLAGNCLQARSPVLRLGFHGGGEPTAAWSLLVQIVDYARKVAGRHDLRVAFAMSTGAVLSGAQAQWLASQDFNLTVSLDGPPEVQDRNRPLKDGSPSYPRVRETLDTLAREGGHYAIQSTVVGDHVARMPEIASWVAENTAAAALKFEPVSLVGSFANEEELIPEPGAFAQHFNRATVVAEEHGLALRFSGVRVGHPPISHFCGAFCSPFSMTPDGRISACFEVYEVDSPLAALFLIGHYRETDGQFVISPERLATLRRRNVFELPACQKCFCKYSCGGDCATRNLRRRSVNGLTDESLYITGARCEMIREITRFQLERYQLKSAANGAATVQLPARETQYAP